MSYSDAPCVGAKEIDATPTQGMDKMTGTSRKGADVRRDEHNAVMADALKPLTGMSADQYRVYKHRFKLSPGDKAECDMCQYHHAGTTMECRGDGYLWDADDDGYDPEDQSMPCPACNTEQYLLSAKEEAETVSEGSDNGFHYTGESMWLGAVRVAEAANDVAAKAALLKICLVTALVPDASNDDGFGTRQYLYQ